MPFAQEYDRCKTIARLSNLRDAIHELRADDLGAALDTLHKYELLAKVESRMRELTDYRPALEQVCPSCGDKTVGRCMRQGCQQ